MNAQAELTAIDELVSKLSDEEVAQRLAEMPEPWKAAIAKTIPADRRGLLIDIYYVSLP